MNDSIEIKREMEFLPDATARKIANNWLKWNTDRLPWLQEKDQTRNYLFATDTRSTEVGQNTPWKNSTVTPKLTQIRDNLHANYMAALFPVDRWFTWVASNGDSSAKNKARAIENYMHAKLKASNFELVVSQLIYDYIDYGNVFVGHEFVTDTAVDKKTAEGTNRYTGPRAFRVSPLDVVMNPISTNFQSTPFIRRVLKSMGDLENDVMTKTTLNYSKSVLNKAKDYRKSWRDDPDFRKGRALTVDGFGNIEEYLDSDMVEILEYWGDIYDEHTGQYLKDQVVTIIDRQWVLRMEANKSWLGQKPFFHCGWRLRPDNLWAAGPLDQLLGLQYRIDHLENLKADVFDLIAYPMSKIKGNTVEEFEYGPGENIFCGDEGDVEFMRPDTTALNADLQIQELMQRMEELAGAPKQAMGIRTPGEKTKYEVMALENASGRIFQNKIAWFERNIIEPALNSMLEEARRLMNGTEEVSYTDPETSVTAYVEITKDDLVGTGKLYPVGARHFAEQAKFVQELNQTVAMVGAFPGLKAHISTKNMAKALEENLGWGNYQIFKEFAGIEEEAEMQRHMSQIQEDLAAESAVNPQEPPNPMEQGAPPPEETSLPPEGVPA